MRTASNDTYSKLLQRLQARRMTLPSCQLVRLGWLGSSDSLGMPSFDTGMLEVSQISWTRALGR